MSSHRTRGVDRVAAERLLAGCPATSHAQLTAVLHAATAPAHFEELIEEGAAASAFRAAAQLGHIPEPRRPSMLKSVLTKGLVAKVAILLAATGSTGVVLAASSGALPWSGEVVTAPPAASHSAAPSASPSATPTGRPSDTGKPGDAGTSASPAVLCNAYEAEVRNNPGKALESTAFRALAHAAGGESKIDAYCATASTAHPTSKPTDLPTPTTDPGSNGKGTPPTTRPTEPGRSHAPVTPIPSGPASPLRGN